MSDKKWFTLSKGQVTGPYSTKEIHELSTNQDPETLYWGRGLSVWSIYDKWKLNASELEQQKTIALSTERIWKVKLQDQECPPMNHDQMIDFLKTVSDLGHVKIWTEGYNEWKDAFQVHKIMDELGVSRRAHPRVPIMGSMTIENPRKEGKVITISEGGFGMTGVDNLEIGQKLKGLIQSENLPMSFHVAVEVVYIRSDGYTGLQLIGIPSEAKNCIIEYVRRFTDSD